MDRFHPAATPGTRAVIAITGTLQGTDVERLHQLAREMEAAARYVLDHNTADIVCPLGLTLGVQTSAESDMDRERRASVLQAREALRAELAGEAGR